MAASSELSILDVVNALHRLSVDETRELVFRLGVPNNVLDNISSQYNVPNRITQYVAEWLKRDVGASWEKLVSALKRIGRNVVANEVESAYISKGEEASIPAASSALSISATPPSLQSVNTLTQLETATPFPASVPTTPAPVELLVVNMEKVEEVRAMIEKFEDEFSNLMSDTQEFLSDKESQDQKFLARFRGHLLTLPISKKAVHSKFFEKNEDDIVKAENIERIFVILRRYSNYSNYDIILHLVKKFCGDDDTLKKRMLDYRDSLESFERATTANIFLHAISACPEMCEAFSRMAMKINKSANECTLHEIRQKKGSHRYGSISSFVQHVH